MKLSEAGKVIAQVWKQLPMQFGNIKTARVQIMPDHLHGIVEIVCAESSAKTGLGLINQTQTDAGGKPESIAGTGERKPDWVLMKQPGIQLGKIIRAFKAKSTRIIRTALDPSFGWHRSFYDRVIRDDIERYFIEEYIELNPLSWELRKGSGHSILSLNDLRTRLQTEHGFTGLRLERIIELESDYRAWLKSEGYGSTSVLTRWSSPTDSR